MNPRPSPMLPAPNDPETDRNVMRHPLSRSSPSSHYKSASNNFPFQGGPPPGAAHHNSSGHVAQSNTLGLSLSNPSTVPLAYRSHSKGGNPYDSRISRHSDMEKMPIREYSESQSQAPARWTVQCRTIQFHLRQLPNTSAATAVKGLIDPAV